MKFDPKKEGEPKMVTKIGCCCWLVALSGCVILVDEAKVPEPQLVTEPVPVPVSEPVPTPVPVPADPFPGSGWGSDVGVDQLWLIRVDRQTANVAEVYEKMVTDFSEALAAKGLPRHSVAVASLYGGELLWASGRDASPPVSLAEALRRHAAATRGLPQSCTTQGLVKLALPISSAQVMHSPASDSGSWAAFKPFAQPSNAFFVGIIESGARPVEWNHPSCEVDGAHVGAHLGGFSPARWLAWDRGHRLPRAQTRFLFVDTGESGTAAQLRERCQAKSEFPKEALDAISPSNKSFFGPLTDEVNRSSTGLATRVDYCQALGGEWPAIAEAFATAWLELLVQQPLPNP